MENIDLYDYQQEAINKMRNGCILCGGVGSGKSRTSLAYYILMHGGTLTPYKPTTDLPDLYIITTARKRDTCEWEDELNPFHLYPGNNVEHSNKVVIDSWNNIKKYAAVRNAFFIFDEQRVVGYGAWTKAFLSIAKSNEWILLSATPGDTWSDYIPVFIANGFYKNKTEFVDRHIIYDWRVKFPKVKGYVNTARLTRLRDLILVPMNFERKTVSNHVDIFVDYDASTYKWTMANRMNPFTNVPLASAGELCYTLRKIVNASEQRQLAIAELLEANPKAIIFYNFDYERDILRGLSYLPDTEVAEWSGHAHDAIPKGDRWVYLVQYTAGCEGWNCITTNTIIFYSQNYSWKVMEQASGRINRLNTPYTNLYYYHIKSHAPIDVAISRALKAKKIFNEGAFVFKH